MDVLFRVMFTLGAVACVAYAMAVALRARGRGGGASRLLAHPRVLVAGLALGIGGLLVDYLWSLVVFF
jgi:hypothetical protein